ncbi:MAG: peptide transporter [Verrucomicrobia bacterium]|nr:peptide transporter [Verrucomicrobiota bacterium]
MAVTASDQTGLKRLLPPIGSTAYYILLAAVAIFILGPLGGISAAYMNFSLGFFVGGQVLAGILGSAVTYGYGPEGKHGANYMQTMAASVAMMSGMAVLIQAMVWLGLPEPPTWQLVLYFTCIGMFGVGVGMLYTPILVDRMQLVYPSGFAVANILRALTDKQLLKRSIAKLGGGTLGGFLGGLAAMKVARIEALGISTSTVGAGMVVGARIAIPGLLVGVIGYYMTPWLRTIGWLGPNDPFRKIGFVLALGTILGAAIVDLTLIGFEAMRRFRQKQQEVVPPSEDWKRVNTTRLIMWVTFWGIALVLVASSVLQQPLLFVITAVVLVFVFVLINGISTGISDSNPISSAFVVAVFLLTTLGLRDPAVGLMCASILLISCGVGVDMQQDRSTGWRLGTNRVIQFRYQVIGIVMGSIMAVVLAKLFMNAYPVLKIDSFSNPNVEGAQQWQSAMTYKFVGALKGLTNPQPHIMKALFIGIGLGFVTEALRKWIKRRPAYQEFVRGNPSGPTADFALDAFLLPSPYASSFGGFVSLLTSFWYAFGGVVASSIETLAKKKNVQPAEGEVPADMSTTSLVGGGLIAGDSLAALSLGIYGLLRTVL